jgi:hypothetical protein
MDTQNMPDGAGKNTPAECEKVAPGTTPEATSENKTATEIISALALSTDDEGRNYVQTSFLPEPDFLPLAPAPHTGAWAILRRLCQGPISQLDTMPQDWRLSARINELANLGWEFIKSPRHCGRKRAIRTYALTPRARAAAIQITGVQNG